MTSVIVNGTTNEIASIASITMCTSIINLLMQAQGYSNVGVGLSLTAVNSSVTAAHSTALPNTPVFYAVALSIVSVVNIVRALTNSSITVDNAHIHRSFLEPTTTTTMVPQGVQTNITTVLNFCDTMSALIAAYPPALIVIDVFKSLGEGTPSTITHINKTVTLTSNCTVTYDIAASPTYYDTLALIVLPGISDRCTYVIEDSTPPQYSSIKGAVVGALGLTQIVNSTVKASRIVGLAMLLVGSLQSIMLEGTGTMIQFENVSLECAFDAEIGAPQFQYAIGMLPPATINVTLPITARTLPAKSSSFLNISHSSFQGFTALLMPASFYRVVSSSLQTPLNRATRAERRWLSLGV